MSITSLISLLREILTRQISHTLPPPPSVMITEFRTKAEVNEERLPLYYCEKTATFFLSMSFLGQIF